MVKCTKNIFLLVDGTYYKDYNYAKKTKTDNSV